MELFWLELQHPWELSLAFLFVSMDETALKPHPSAACSTRLENINDTLAWTPESVSKHMNEIDLAYRRLTHRVPPRAVSDKAIR